MPLLPDSDPIILKGGPQAVLVMHGFTGQPRSVKPWANYLHVEGGLTVSVPRLPGHGTTWQELNRTRWEDWYAEAERSFLALRADHDEVFVMGLSMGATLVLRLAQERADEVAGVAVANPSVFTTRLDRHLLPYVRHVIGGFPGITNDIKAGGDEGGYDKIPLQAAYSLSKLWGITREDLPRITAPLLVFTSVEDHVVEPENSELVLESVSSTHKRQVLLHDSYHVATLDNDAEKIFSQSLEFVHEYSGAHDR